MSVYKQRVRRLMAAILARGVPRGILTDPQFFSLWERRGLHILRASFYSPVPVLAALNGHANTRRETLSGIQWRDDAQRDLLNSLSPIAAAEALDLSRHVASHCLPKGAYGGADRTTLYCLLRHIAPRRVIEVGAGVSTFITAHALERNEQDDGRGSVFTSIDPYPNPILTGNPVGRCRRIARPVQDMPLDEFETLEDGDVLFIDSTHVCKVASDVNFLILEVLPNLKPGVWVHFHDIFLPNDYPKEWIEQTHRFWNEQYLLQAFLAFNKAYQVELATNYLAHACGSDYPDIFEDDEVIEPGSFWIRKIA